MFVFYIYIVLIVVVIIFWIIFFFWSLSLLQIQLAVGPESSIAVGWQKKEKKMSAAGEVKVHLCLLLFEHVKIFSSQKAYYTFKKGPYHGDKKYYNTPVNVEVLHTSLEVMYTFINLIFHWHFMIHC